MSWCGGVCVCVGREGGGVYPKVCRAVGIVAKAAMLFNLAGADLQRKE